MSRRTTAITLALAAVAAVLLWRRWAAKQTASGERVRPTSPLNPADDSYHKEYLKWSQQDALRYNGN